MGREWYGERFAEIARRLAGSGLRAVLVGDCWHADHAGIWPDGTIDLRGSTTIHQMGHIVKHARLFVGVDSFPFHVAQALNVPGVAFFGCVLPELRIYRRNMIGVSASHLPCIGCHHARRAAPGEPPETQVCRIGFEHCRQVIDVDRFWTAVESQLRSHHG